MPYNFVADSFHIKKLCSRLSSSEVRFFAENSRFCVFEPSLGDIWATYDNHLRLILKHVVNFHLMLIYLFCRCYVWGATIEYWFKMGDFAPTGAGWPNISGTRRRPHTNLSSSQKTRLNNLSYDIKIWTDLSSILSQSTRMADRRTDRQNFHL